MKLSSNGRRIIVGLLLTFCFWGCTTKKVMEDDDAKFKDINDEFNQVVKIDEITAQKTKKSQKTQATTPETAAKPALPLEASKAEATKTATTNEVKPVPIVKGVTKASAQMPPREPKIEDSENFVGRRPMTDPFMQNEKVVLAVNYFNVEAGEFALSVKPFKMVNNRKAYHYQVNVKSNKMFSMFYAVDNNAETFVDYETLLPLTFSINVRESSRLKEVRMFFNRENSTATYWEKTVKKNEAEKKKKKEWEIESYAQNVISAIYYLRNFTLYAGKKLAFYVADDGKNLTFRGEVVREEKLKTVLGELDTVVVKINFEMDDQFKQTGDNLIWLTKDKHRYIVRIESKVKIGTLVAKLKSIQSGVP